MAQVAPAGSAIYRTRGHHRTSPFWTWRLPAINARAEQPGLGDAVCGNLLGRDPGGFARGGRALARNPILKRSYRTTKA